jgi:hypothetical protein
MVITDNIKTVFLNYDGLNYLTTRDEEFCSPAARTSTNLVKRSTIISETSEKTAQYLFWNYARQKR